MTKAYSVTGRILFEKNYEYRASLDDVPCTVKYIGNADDGEIFILTSSGEKYAPLVGESLVFNDQLNESLHIWGRVPPS